MTRHDFKAGVKEILAHRAGFRCSKPDCRAATAGPGLEMDSRGSIGIAAHITAASPGGPRYDESIDEELRGSVTNGIWLCDTHARSIDGDVSRFTVDILRTWKNHAEELARAMVGRPIAASGLDVAMDLVLQRDPIDGLVVLGTTNLPDGTKVMGDLRWRGPFPYFGQARGTVFRGHFLLGPFTTSSRPLPQRWYQASVYAHFNGAWQQPKHVIDLVGEDGSKLIGDLARPIDPDIDESNYSVQFESECPAPPQTSEAPLSRGEVDGAIGILHGSTLDVLGHAKPRSSERVIDVVKHLTKPTTGLRERDGWSARSVIPGIAEVTYSFWNGQKPAEAIWQVMVRANEVRYRNRHAKLFSWLPDY